MSYILMTKSTFPIIGWFATIFGWIMNIVYNLFAAIGIQNIGVCIILFTVLTALLTLPLTINQQKFLKISGLMQPELQAVQKKYRGRTDSASAAKMNAETQAVYDRYGVSPMGSCLPLLLQFPIMLGLYQVILRMPAYIDALKAAYMNIVTPMLQQTNFIEGIGELAGKHAMSAESIATNADLAVDFLYKFKDVDWVALEQAFPAMGEVLSQHLGQIQHMNSFLTMNLANSPANNIMSVAILIPILAGLTNWLSTKMMTSTQSAATEQMGMMKSVNMMMPIMSVVFCFTLPIGVGLYWVMNTVSRMVCQLGVNKYMDSMDINDLISKNIQKKNKKRAAKGLPPINEQQMLKNIEKEKKRLEKESSTREIDAEKRDELQAKATEYYIKRHGGSNSISAKARMVKDYNERNSKK
ncbi:MAG: YidC/Oxa1 family membrane protein insertase [Lachnospiraceae bacterium]|nr:YidC/Oxa1 family membrane protein insertase [Lachnospiraceae bacterium]